MTKAKAKPLGLDRQVGDLPDDFLDCRYPNHSWKRLRVYPVYVDRRKYVRIDFACKCGAKRKDILSGNGDRISSSIDYSDAEGYLIEGHGRVDRAMFRVETIGRFLTEANGNGKKK